MLNVLIITKTPKATGKIKEALRNVNINSFMSRPNDFEKIWLTQFHLVYIEPPMEDREYENCIKIIRDSNWQIPILLHHKPQKTIHNSCILPQAVRIKDLVLLIRSIARPKTITPKIKIKYKDLVLDIEKRAVKRKDQILKLRNKEFSLLELLLEKKGQTVTKQELIEILWDRNTTLLSNTVEAHISQLRKKIDKDYDRKLIHTVPCVGYRLE
ncbi:MAG: winged helix-turn-helix domain-containing protein [Candidatus Gracilibacteria bacterium]|jgi:DNA-binding response OmpR family regulator